MIKKAYRKNIHLLRIMKWRYFSRTIRYIKKWKKKRSINKQESTTHTNTWFKNYDTYHEQLSEEWINERLKHYVAYTIVLSAVKLSRKPRHSTLWVGLINLLITIKSLQKGQVWLNIILASYSVSWIKSISNILD